MPVIVHHGPSMSDPILTVYLTGGPRVVAQPASLLLLHALGRVGYCAPDPVQHPQQTSPALSRVPLPQVRELVHAFYNSQYAAALRCLEALKPALRLDLHVADVSDGLHLPGSQRGARRSVTEKCGSFVECSG